MCGRCWSQDEQVYRGQLSQLLDLAHVIKLSDEDHEWLEPKLSLEEHARALLARPNCELVIVTLGEQGSLAFTTSGQAPRRRSIRRRSSSTRWVPAIA